mmetsp:Transcript_32014/g.56628  ORF Transcript_32014/g.56628 Transcript_32014/m.56628 type:complete len:125 (-) Transcript_32014:649-1023(-)
MEDLKNCKLNVTSCTTSKSKSQSNAQHWHSKRSNEPGECAGNKAPCEAAFLEPSTVSGAFYKRLFHVKTLAYLLICKSYICKIEMLIIAVNILAAHAARDYEVLGEHPFHFCHVFVKLVQVFAE